MPKLAIYVPKKEMKEIEKWRREINFSQVFMRALTREIRQRTRSTEAEPSQLSAAADFYRRQLECDSDALEEAGYQLGSRQVLDCELQVPIILRLSRMCGDDGGAASWTVEQRELLVNTVGKDGRFMDELGQRFNVDDQSHPLWKDVVLRGYVRGVAAAWSDVCNQIRTNS